MMPSLDSGVRDQVRLVGEDDVARLWVRCSRHRKGHRRHMANDRYRQGVAEDAERDRLLRCVLQHDPEGHDLPHRDSAHLVAALLVADDGLQHPGATQ